MRAARQIFLGRGAGADMPYDYAVEYIETDGVASYIDTGITPLVSTVTTMSVQVISVPNTSSTNLLYNPLFGASNGSSTLNGGFSVVAQTGAGYFRTSVPNMPSGSTSPNYDTNIHEISLGSEIFDFDGVHIGTGTISSTKVFGVFCLGSRGAQQLQTNPQYGFTNTRFYSCKIYTNNVLVFDGIPVVANGLAGLYDSISGTVKTNAAETGTITAGPRRAQ